MPVELTGWRRTLHLKLRFGAAKLPFVPVRYRLHTPGHPDFFFRWTRVIPFMDPARGAFDFALYGWDVRELRFLRRFLRAGMTFLDVGAHHGLYTVLASALVGNTGRVLAIEPSPACARRLRWHVRLNGGRNVVTSELAAGNRRGRVELFVPTRGVDTVSSLRPPGFGNGAPRSVTVDILPLDEIVAGQRGGLRPDLIKLDVEGAEADVLDGAGAVRDTHAPIWMFEALDATSASWSSSGRALVTRFVESGHVIFEFLPDGRVRPHRRREQYPLDSNCNLLAVPASKRSLVSALTVADETHG